jgi:L-methionine (R)-S-oxide reductase
MEMRLMEMRQKMKNEDTTRLLVDLSAFLEKQPNLDVCLRDLAVMAANILNMENCSVMLLREEEEDGNEHRLRIFAHSGALPESAHREAMKIKEGISGYVVATGEPLFVEDIEHSRFAALKRGRYKSKGFISAPILVNKKAVGVINANTPRNRSNVRREDLELLGIIALLISKSIQLIHLQGLLNSKYAQFALALEEKDLRSGNVGMAMSQDPDKMAKLLAKTFYNEMAKAGFGADHMISVATEILSLLTDRLHKHSQRHTRPKNSGKSAEGE